MKKFIPIFALLIASIVNAATLVPIQLLNPTGSVAGQAIVSTGASSAPGWTSVLPSANPVATGTFSITNSATGGSTVTVSATSNTSNGATIQLNGNGVTTPNKFLRAFNGNLQVVNSGNTAAIASMDDSGNLSINGALTPSQTAGIIGTTTSNNANTGSIGEYATNTASGVSLTSLTATTITSVSLTAGDWDVSGVVSFSPTSTGLSIQLAGTSTTNNTLGAFGTYQSYQFAGPSGAGSAVLAPATRVSLSATTTVYLVAEASFSSGSCTATGFIRARRVR